MSGKTVILLIEDHLSDVHLTQLYFEEFSSKYQLLVANSYEAGKIISSNQSIDLVLLDLSLPDSSGIKTLERFLKDFPNVPVVVMTSTPNEILGNQVIKAGAQDFLVKGQFDPRMLNRSIRYSLQRFADKKKLEDAYQNLALSEKRYIEAQSIAQFGDWELDIVTNEMIWSDEVFRIFGYPPKSITPTLSRYLNYVPAEEKLSVEQFFEQVAKDGNGHSIEHRIIRDGNRYRHLALHAKLMYDESTNKITVVGSVQDITERKINHQLLLEKKMWSQALKILQEIITDLGFHIRTQLYSLASYLYLLEKSLHPNPEQEEFIQVLKTALEELSMATNNLVNFSVIGADKMFLPNYNTIEIEKEIKQLTRLLSIRFNQSEANIDCVISPELPTYLFADIQKINQILFNLAEYYIQGDSNSKILSLHVDIQPSSKPNQSYLLVTILPPPNALPIPDRAEIKKDLEKAPNSSSIAELKENNPKLGLFVAFELLDALNAVFTQSQEQELLIQFPVDIPTTQKQGYPKAPEHPLHILLAEDHFLNQIATQKVLQNWSDIVKVDIASDGKEAIQKCSEFDYDLILMDLKMPNIDGFEAARQIREQQKMPIIGLSANSSQQEKMAVIEAGMNDYLEKPFRPEDLYLKIIHVLNYAPR